MYSVFAHLILFTCTENIENQTIGGEHEGVADHPLESTSDHAQPPPSYDSIEYKFYTNPPTYEEVMSGEVSTERNQSQENVIVVLPQYETNEDAPSIMSRLKDCFSGCSVYLKRTLSVLQCLLLIFCFFGCIVFSILSIAIRKEYILGTLITGTILYLHKRGLCQ